VLEDLIVKALPALRELNNFRIDEVSMWRFACSFGGKRSFELGSAQLNLFQSEASKVQYLHSVYVSTSFSCTSTEMSRKTAKKRAEIAEYTSLIRFLHTTSTQDALPHLLVPSSASVPFFSDSTTPSPFRQLTHLASPDSLLATSPFSGEDMQVKAVRSDLVGNDRIVVQSESREEEIVSIPGSQGKRKERSTWTRWPLLKGDVYIPEWTLQDEIQALASKAIREWINTNATTDPHMNQEALTSQPSQPDESVECSNPIENSPASPTNPQSGMTQAATGDTPMDHVATEDSPVEDNSLESAMLHPGVISGLTLEVENLLSRIFGALAAHLPLVDKSMQDRLQPMDGRAVLDIVGQAGIVDPERVITSLLFSWV